MGVEQRRERQEELRPRHKLGYNSPWTKSSLLRLRRLIRVACELGDRLSSPLMQRLEPRPLSEQVPGSSELDYRS